MNQESDAQACGVLYVHRETVEAISDQLPMIEEIRGMAEVFKLLGDPTRLRIVHALSLGELCVCDLAAMLGIAQTAVSNHLRLLRSTRLVNHRREGKMAYYSLTDTHIKRLLGEGFAHVTEAPAGPSAAQPPLQEIRS